MARKSFPLSKVYGLLEPGPVVKAWIDPAVKNPRTIHHCGSGNFMVAGEKIKLRSKMK